MSEDSDYTPSSWSRDHSFDNARRDYQQHRQTSHQEAEKNKTTHKDLVPETIQVSAEYLLAFMQDLTGSMGEWPGTFFSKCPYLEYEAKVYLGSNLQFLFTAIEDAGYDKYPAQITQPAQGAEIKDSLTKLVHERGCGGGNGRESHELLALYFARKVFMPNLKHKPILILLTDEAPYKEVRKDWVKKYLNIDIRANIETKKIFEELKRKFNVYLIKKPYQHSMVDAMTATDRRIYEEWVDLLGEEKIALLADSNRAVDIVFAILACETDRVEYCIKEFEQRQGQDSDYAEKRRIFDIATRPLFAPFLNKGKSVSRKEEPHGKKMKKLL